MDGSFISPDKRYVLLDRQLADIIDDMHPDDLQLLAELVTSVKDCACGCRGRAHISVTTSDGRRSYLVGRLSSQADLPNA
jgi:hypothetical protein